MGDGHAGLPRRPLSLPLNEREPASKRDVDGIANACRIATRVALELRGDEDVDVARCHDLETRAEWHARRQSARDRLEPPRDLRDDTTPSSARPAAPRYQS